MSEAIPTIILCGGRGTRMAEAGTTVPKALIPVGDKPVLWHIMKLYAHHGQTSFVLALGWLGEAIKEFVLHYETLTSDFTLELGKPNSIELLGSHPDHGWKLTCIDTGIEALKGTRLRRAAAHLPPGPVMVTYGDGIGDVDITALLEFHRAHGKLVTITAVHPPGRFGEMLVDDSGRVSKFEEKPASAAGAINGGFMVFEREAIDAYIPAGVDIDLEEQPLTRLAADGELMAFAHHGFWHCMDTPKERALLTEMWESDKAPWKVWA